MAIPIRRANMQDAPAIARVRIDSWRVTCTFGPTASMPGSAGEAGYGFADVGELIAACDAPSDPCDFVVH
jgi:hypothetical protein